MMASPGQRLALGAGVAFVALWTLVPLLVMLWASLIPLSDLIGGLVRWPSDISLATYRAILGIDRMNEVFGGQAEAIGRGFVNSAIVAIPVAAIGTALAVLGGYAFGRYRFPFKSTLLFILLSVRVLPPIAILIPYFVILSALRLVGTYTGLVITYLTAVIPLMTWVLMGYFAGLPQDIERAARIDGCSRLRALWHVTVPMAAPGIAAAFVIAFLTAWNELLFALILTNRDAVTIPVSLAGIASDTERGALWGPLTAVGTLTVVPVVLFALAVQRYLIRGLAHGSMAN